MGNADNGGDAAPEGKKESAVVKYFKDFGILKETRSEYWSLQIINTLDCIAYFAMFNIVIVSLSSDFGFGDVSAGYVFTLFTSLTTICLFFSGVVTDWLGIKRAMYVAMLGLLVMRCAVVFAAYLPETAGFAVEPFQLEVFLPGGFRILDVIIGPVVQYRHVLVMAALTLMAPCMAMVQTVFQAANKRFTTKRSRGAGFNLWYLYMNVGAAAGGFLVDILFLTFGLPRFHVFSFGIVSAVICVVVNFAMIRRTEQLRSADEESEEADGEEKKKGKGPLEIVKAVASEPVFWRFTALITLLLGVRAVFLYLGVLHPKFWLRVIGPEAQVGALQAFNPILVIIGLVLFIPVLKRFDVYKMLVGGALITSVSLFIQAIPPFGGYDLAAFTYVTTILFLFVLTIGELIWSPRLTEYTAAIAPEGQEGTYLGLSMVPYFLAKTVVTVLSGHMLTRWCPEDIGDKLRAGAVAFWDSPSAMWFILGAVALVGSVSALLLKGWFTKGVSFAAAEGAAPAEEPDEEEAGPDLATAPAAADKPEKAPAVKPELGLAQDAMERATGALRWGIVGMVFMGFICGPVAIIQSLAAKEALALHPEAKAAARADIALILGIAALALHGLGLLGGMLVLALMPLLG